MKAQSTPVFTVSQIISGTPLAVFLLLPLGKTGSRAGQKKPGWTDPVG